MAGLLHAKRWYYTSLILLTVFYAAVECIIFFRFLFNIFQYAAAAVKGAERHPTQEGLFEAILGALQFFAYVFVWIVSSLWCLFAVFWLVDLLMDIHGLYEHTREGRVTKRHVAGYRDAIDLEERGFRVDDNSPMESDMQDNTIRSKAGSQLQQAVVREELAQSRHDVSFDYEIVTQNTSDNASAQVLQRWNGHPAGFLPIVDSLAEDWYSDRAERDRFVNFPLSPPSLSIDYSAASEDSPVFVECLLSPSVSRGTSEDSQVVVESL